MRVLVTGAGGLLAGAVTREFGKQGDVVALDRSALDITDDGRVHHVLDRARPDAIVNCAAYNNVDGAEDDATHALLVNALAVRTLSRAAHDRGTVFVHYSTDFVFAGEGTRPYREGDPPNPRSVYAASKLLGEWFALEHPASYVLRVESLFGVAGAGGSRQGSVAGIVSRIRAGESVPVFVDRTVSPSYTFDVARATRRLLERKADPGLYHCVNSGAATWVDIAREAARLLDRPMNIQAITLETVTFKAPRPKYCALDNGKLAAAGIEMPTWRDALRRHLLGP
jgi:dTDP-4-dehydrorhamnose reductase